MARGQRPNLFPLGHPLNLDGKAEEELDEVEPEATWTSSESEAEAKTSGSKKSGKTGDE